jgi:hypothetical protein
MHTYSTDNDLRPRIVGFLGIGSFLLVLGIERVLSIVNTTVPFGPNFSAPATGAVFTVVYVVFAAKVWNHGVFRRLRLVKTPYFGGRWEGYVRSSYNVDDDAENEKPEEQEKTNVEVEIEQSWRKMIVRLEGDDSSSRSLGASIITQQGRPKLTYYYLNEPDYDAPDSYTMGYGTTSVKLYEGEGDNNEDVLDGIYYTGPDRGEHGKIHLTRVDDE